MKIIKYIAAVSCSLFLSGSIYASVTELNAYNVDKCRQQLKDSFHVNFAAILVYSKNTDQNTLKLFDAVSEERPNTPFFKFNLDNDSIVKQNVSRLCLAQLSNLHDNTLMLMVVGEDGTDIAFQSAGFGARDGILSNKSQVEAVIDDSNDKMMIKRKS